METEKHLMKKSARRDDDAFKTPLPKRKRIQVEDHSATKTNSVSFSTPPTSVDRLPKVKRTSALEVPLFATTTVATTTNKKKTATQKQDDEIPLEYANKIQFGVTRKQRAIILQMIKDGISRHLKEEEEHEVDDYATRVEQRLYDGIFGLDLDSMCNMYRERLYRQRAFEMIWAFRSSAPYLMATYEPELLVSLPPFLLARNTPAGQTYKEWLDKKTRQEEVERLLMQARKEEKGEGWLKCNKCGGKFSVSTLQMRGADEPATVFLDCQNCGFTKRKG